MNCWLLEQWKFNTCLQLQSFDIDKEKFADIRLGVKCVVSEERNPFNTRLCAYVYKLETTQSLWTVSNRCEQFTSKTQALQDCWNHL